MPYTPSVQDRSGEILGKGIESLGKSASDAIDYYTKDTETREFLNTAVKSKLGTALKQMQDFQANKAAYGGVAPLNPEMLEKFQNIGGASTAKLKALNADFDVMLQRSASALNESFTIAKTREMNSQAEMQAAKTANDRAFSTAMPIILGMANSQDQVNAISKLPFSMQNQALDMLKKQGELTTGNLTSEMKNTEEILRNEALLGKFPNEAARIARKAELMAGGGRAVIERYGDGGTVVNRSDGGNPTNVVRNNITGVSGTVDKDGKFQPLDWEKFKPITTSDSNPNLSPDQFQKLASTVITHETGVRAINRLAEDVGGLPSGINKLITSFSGNLSTALGRPLTKEEETLGLEKSRVQRVLGVMRTTVLGPGVLTENDAQRILSAIGGDIGSIFTNKAVIQKTLGEILQDKMTQYEFDLGVYNAGVRNQYGIAGYKERSLLPAFRAGETPTSPAGGSKWTEKP